MEKDLGISKELCSSKVIWNIMNEGDKNQGGLGQLAAARSLQADVLSALESH